MKEYRLNITKEAKKKAKESLELRNRLPKYKRFGLDKKEAKRLKINSGVERAKQLINSKSISYKDAVAVAKFSRWLKRPRTQRVQGSIDLWGGEDFIKKAREFVRRNKK